MKSVELQIYRHWKTDSSTIGILSVDNRFFCFTLENPLEKNGVKIKGKTAIPAGHYKMVLDYSPKFKCVTPRLLGVPRYTDIRIHVGNFIKDTDGCPLVGICRDNDKVLRSRVAFNILMAELKKYDEWSIRIF